MKVVIWFVVIVIASLITVLFPIVVSGGLIAFLYYIAVFAIAKKLCSSWDYNHGK